MGRIGAPFGIQGWVKLHPYGDDPLAWEAMPQWWLCANDEAPDTQWHTRALRACRQHGNGVIAAFEGVSDRNSAEALKGLYFGAPREAMPAPDDDEYYWGDLIGLTVENAAGEVLGKVTTLLSTGAHDVLQVDDAECERLIPFVPAYVNNVDTEKGRIYVTWQKDW